MYRAMHMMRAEVVVWHMGFALLDALYMVKTDLTRVTRSAALAGEFHAFYTHIIHI